MIKKIMYGCDSDCGGGCGDCDCGCESGQEIMTLSLDDGTELECIILSIFPAGEREYIALLPTHGKEAENGEVFLYRYVETPNGEPDLSNIEDDDEYEIVADAFDQLLDEMDYDEIVEEEK